MQLQWTIDYDVAAMAFLTVLLLFISRSRHVRTVQNRLFIWLSYLMLAATALDLITAFTLSNTQAVPLALNNVLNVLCLLCSQIMPIVLLLYLFTALRVWNYRTKKWLWAYFIPTVPAMGMIIASPATRLVFYFDEQARYMHGSMWSAMFIPGILIVCVSVIYIVRYWHRLTKLQNIALLSFDVMIVLGMLLQALFFEWILLTYFCMSLSLFIVYLALQRQEYYLTKMADMFNADAFTDVYEEAVRLKRAFGFALIEIPDIRQLFTMYGQPLSSALIERVNQTLSAEFGRDNVFMLSITRFSVYLAKPADKQLTRCIDAIRTGWIIDKTRYCLPCAATMITNADYMPAPENLHAFLELAASAMISDMKPGVVDMSAEAYQRLHRRMDVQRALHQAIENKTLNAYYQPIYDAATRRVCLAEALARIEDDRLGVVPAYEFIDIAERDGSIASMTALLFERVCETIRLMGEKYPTVKRIGFNLSAAQLMQNNLVETLLSIAESHGVSLDRFAFELTESEPITRSGQIGQSIDWLCASGAELSLDDFGTGYSNFSKILDISFQTVKIDKSLVQGYMLGRSGFLKHLCDMFHDAGMTIIAEGIENEQQAEELSQIGCDMLQGFYFSKPIPEKELLALLGNEAVVEA